MKSISFLSPRDSSRKGFTLPEMMISSGIAGLAFVLAATALMGFRYSTVATIKQVETRYRNHNALEKMGRYIMESTRVEVEELDDDTSILHVWRDNQIIWTPETTEDDIEGELFLDYDAKELKFRPDKTTEDFDELIAEEIDTVHFEKVGNALFARLTMTYDPDTPGAEREILASFVTRNNPKARQGASN